MYKFSTTSQKRLDTCHPKLQMIMNEVIKMVDISILEGHRTLQRQKQLFDAGKSKIDGIERKGNHNYTPSRAVDIAPYPINWYDEKGFEDLAKIVFSVANKLNIKLRWGGDWDMDGDRSDNRFDDLPHFELHKSEE